MTAIETHGLQKWYGRVMALTGLDLEVPTGSVFGLLGPNGAGKSTTFGILCGWLRQSSGSATVLGTPCNEIAKLRGRVTALPQDARFPDSVTILQQLEHFGRLTGLTPSAARQEAHRALERVGLTDATSKRGNQLSHGMAKRAGIAQALIGNPDLILLDEPTAGLDPTNARAVRDLIRSAAPQATVVVSSHNLMEIQDICTHGAILDHGKLVASGPISTLTKQGEELAIRIGQAATVPIDALNHHFGEGAARIPEPGRLIISYAGDTDPSVALRAALELLFAADVPVYEVGRGRSLETAYLDLTTNKP